MSHTILLYPSAAILKVTLREGSSVRVAALEQPPRFS